MDIIELSIKAYIQARKRVETGCEKYITECKKKGSNTILLTNDVEPFAALIEALFWAISLIERKNDISLNQEQIGLISGLRYIINIMKHCTEVFPVYSLHRPGIKISAVVEDNPDRPKIKDVTMEPTLVFGKIEDISANQGHSNQRENYIKCIQEKSVQDIMKKLDAMLKTLYPSDW